MINPVSDKSPAHTPASNRFIPLIGQLHFGKKTCIPACGDQILANKLSTSGCHLYFHFVKGCTGFAVYQQIQPQSVVANRQPRDVEGQAGLLNSLWNPVDTQSYFIPILPIVVNGKRLVFAQLGS